MVYDPCAPQIPAAPAGGVPHAPHHHRPAYRLLGRRVSRTHGPKLITDACIKTGQKLPKPTGLAAVVAPLFNPGVLTVAGMSVVGASAFGGAILPDILGTAVIPSGGAGPPHRPGAPTPVPEPGSAAILAVAMLVVLISAWFQGSRVLRRPPESEIAAKPLPKRRRAPPRQAREKPAAGGVWTLPATQR